MMSLFNFCCFVLDWHTQDGEFNVSSQDEAWAKFHANCGLMDLDEFKATALFITGDCDYSQISTDKYVLKPYR